MYNREVKLTGHIIDSLTLPRALDLIMDMGGDFQILEFKVGKRKKDTSLARIKVSAESEALLGEILDELAESVNMVAVTPGHSFPTLHTYPQ